MKKSKIIWIMIIAIIIAFLIPSLLKVAFNIGIIVLVLASGYTLYKVLKIKDDIENVNKKKKV